LPPLLVVVEGRRSIIDPATGWLIGPDYLDSPFETALADGLPGSVGAIARR